MLDDGRAAGRYNAVAPGIAANAEFTAAFARRLRRPVLWSVPEWLFRAVGEASILLRGQNVGPRRTLEAGCVFRHLDIDGALAGLVRVTI